MQKTKRNVGVLAACQALLLTNGVTLIALNGLVGFALAEDKALATLPVTTYVLGSALTTLPASLWMKRVGRRAGFSAGALLGMVGALLCTVAVYYGSFWLLCAGTLVSGIYNAFGQYYRFAAADVAAEDFKSKAISLVLAGGIVGGILGPEASKLTKDLLAVPFMASYASLMAFGALSLGLVQLVHFPRLSDDERKPGGRAVQSIMAQPVFVVAALGAMAGYGVMNLLMTATPIAMNHHHHPYSDAAFVIEWHVIGMFAPAFFTGALVRRFGVLPVMLAGTGLMAACVAIAVSGTALYNFWSALVLLGVGWNFLYVGGTTLLTECYTPAEKAKTQGVNDFLIFLTMATSSLSSGVLVTSEGWRAMNFWALPFLALTAAATVWLILRRRAAAQPA
ncbi:MAG: MFS transporter [Betaproteobacteria bacterium]|nr:MFS transporter [Betaproteobacteria bacterium]